VRRKAPTPAGEILRFAEQIDHSLRLTGVWESRQAYDDCSLRRGRPFRTDAALEVPTHTSIAEVTGG
jgi:hypothetical protein